ncbi:uncharacterized protein K441DRAFT_723560, partial [Cenococcum geophilum 1.58]|uniref:uncharacterized protein n=1 Tax=Cenococcum geophilum 1.58 TaxID=794803 RepID=UPI00358EE3A1
SRSRNGAWGLGLFQSDYNYDVIDEPTNESGLRPNDNDWQWLLHPKDPDQSTSRLWRSLDTCHEYIAMDKIHPSLREPRYSLTTPSYKLVIIGAPAMQLGCHLSSEFRAWLEENYRKVGFMNEGLAAYKNEKPHDFGSLGLNDTMAMGGLAVEDSRGIEPSYECGRLMWWLEPESHSKDRNMRNC